MFRERERKPDVTPGIRTIIREREIGRQVNRAQMMVNVKVLTVLDRLSQEGFRVDATRGLEIITEKIQEGCAQRTPT
eukprot:7265575-Prymnesium_polylepis.1